MSIKIPQRRAAWHDALDAQIALWRWYRTPMGRLYMEDSLAANAGALSLEDTRNLIVQMYHGEMQRLLDTDPIFVSSEMCEVIEAASKSFAPEPLRETDLITPRGFIYFEQPFIVPDRFEDPTTIAGVSWHRLIHGTSEAMKDRVLEMTVEKLKEYGHEARALSRIEDEILASEPSLEPWGISLTIYASTAQYLPGEAEENIHAHQVRDLYPTAGMPPLIPLHLTPWYFNMSFNGNEWDEVGRPTGAEWWWRIVQTTFRLMQQRIAVKHLNRPDKATRREAKKLKMPDDTQIVVVRLRREKGDQNEPTGESANYSHRFIVGGHWRNQPYTSLGIWRQIWISPYVKGPADKPLIVRPKRVFQWDR